MKTDEMSLLPEKFRQLCKICHSTGERKDGSICPYCKGRGWVPDSKKTKEIAAWGVSWKVAFNMQIGQVRKSQSTKPKKDILGENP